MTDQEDHHSDRPREIASNVKREIRAPRAAGVAGVVFAGLFVASLALLQKASHEGTAADAAARHNSAIAVAGLYLAPFAGIAFLWFMAVIRDMIGEREDKFFSTVFFGSGLLFVAMLFVGAAVAGGVFAGVAFQGAPPPSAEAVDSSRSLAYTIMLVYASKVAGVFMMSASTVMRRGSPLSTWVSLLGTLAALVLMFSVSFWEPVILLFPAWVVIVSVLILTMQFRPRHMPAPAGGGNGRLD
jgi:hypothetical protein